MTDAFSPRIKLSLMELKELHELEAQRENFDIADETMVKECYDLRQQLKTYSKDMRDVINHPNYSLQFMQSGRLVKIKYQEHDFGWGAVVNFTPIKPGKGQKQEDMIPQESFVIDVLLQVADASSSNGAKTFHELPPGIRPPTDGEQGRMEVVPVLLSAIESIGHLRLFLPPDLKPADQRNAVRKRLEEVKRRFPDGIAVLDPIENMGITDASFKKLLRVRSYPVLRIAYHTEDGPRKSKSWNQGSCRIHCTTRLACQSSTTSMQIRYIFKIRSEPSRRRSRLPCRSCSLTNSNVESAFFVASASSTTPRSCSSRLESPVRSVQEMSYS